MDAFIWIVYTKLNVLPYLPKMPTLFGKMSRYTQFVAFLMLGPYHPRQNCTKCIICTRDLWPFYVCAMLQVNFKWCIFFYHFLSECDLPFSFLLILLVTFGKHSSVRFMKNFCDFDHRTLDLTFGLYMKNETSSK